MARGEETIGYPYQPYFCEENVWRMCVEGTGAREGFSRYALFVTNTNRTVACWAQRACQEPDIPVVWDYHVVLLQRQENLAEIHDPDCLAGSPLAAADWLAATFPKRSLVRSDYQPAFRVVEEHLFLAHFASDRSHMRGASGEWLAPIPAWDPPNAPAHNLDRWLDLAPGGHGTILDHDGLTRFISSG